MSFMMDPLAKPEWSPIDADRQEAVVGALVSATARGTTPTEKLGFNASMAALEDHLTSGPAVAALFVARSDLSAAESLPLALACAAGGVRLVTLPKGAPARLGGEGVVAVLATSPHTALLRLVESVDPPRLDWAYKAAQTGKKQQ